MVRRKATCWERAGNSPTSRYLRTFALPHIFFGQILTRGLTTHRDLAS